jgi:hypothetical protein
VEPQAQHIPDLVLLRILELVPQAPRLSSCALVERRWAEAAAAATTSVSVCRPASQLQWRDLAPDASALDWTSRYSAQVTSLSLAAQDASKGDERWCTYDIPPPRPELGELALRNLHAPALRELHARNMELTISGLQWTGSTPTCSGLQKLCLQNCAVTGPPWYHPAASAEEAACAYGYAQLPALRHLSLQLSEYPPLPAHPPCAADTREATPDEEAMYERDYSWKLVPVPPFAALLESPAAPHLTHLTLPADGCLAFPAALRWGTNRQAVLHPGLSALTSLQALRVEGLDTRQAGTAPAAAAQLAALAALAGSLTWLELAFVSGARCGGARMLEPLSALTGLQHLVLHGLQGVDVSTLAAHLSQLQHLDLPGCSVDTPGATAALLDLAGQQKQATWLGFNSCLAHAVQQPALYGGLTVSPALEHLHMNASALPAAAWQAMFGQQDDSSSDDTTTSSSSSSKNSGRTVRWHLRSLLLHNIHVLPPPAGDCGAFGSSGLRDWAGDRKRHGLTTPLLEALVASAPHITRLALTMPAQTWFHAGVPPPLQLAPLLRLHHLRCLSVDCSHVPTMEAAAGAIAGLATHGRLAELELTAPFKDTQHMRALVLAALPQLRMLRLWPAKKGACDWP